MLSLISNLQRKPEHTRKKIAFVSSVVLTGVIVLFWLVSLSVRESEPVVAAQDEDTGPFQAVTESVGTFFADVGTAFKDMKKAFSNVPEEVKASADTSEAAPVSE
ncbi:MAG: hypothetical protein UY50_C0031G0020 [Parcubacteria group bacterium GW2011_GWA2_49_9]|nr:MAG: hypothetical protein UY50_C0031G0020 [Parcubacteria group bacterium GW2011_GWA2_49_9]